MNISEEIYESFVLLSLSDVCLADLLKRGNLNGLGVHLKYTWKCRLKYKKVDLHGQCGYLTCAAFLLCQRDASYQDHVLGIHHTPVGNVDCHAWRINYDSKFPGLG